MPREKLRDFIVTKKAFKYPLVDVNNKLRGKKVTFKLMAEFVPVLGWIHMVI